MDKLIPSPSMSDIYCEEPVAIINRMAEFPVDVEIGEDFSSQSRAFEARKAQAVHTCLELSVQNLAWEELSAKTDRLIKSDECGAFDSTVQIETAEDRGVQNQDCSEDFSMQNRAAEELSIQNLHALDQASVQNLASEALSDQIQHSSEDLDSSEDLNSSEDLDSSEVPMHEDFPFELSSVVENEIPMFGHLVKEQGRGECRMISLASACLLLFISVPSCVLLYYFGYSDGSNMSALD
eukprot:TRINITY_DN98_c0_g1_i10.p1 TRINITY_DN98_c0_g1~~TRINITY_DN98_c0_g1_i10.p1  ORF type:complete len:238 (-),score=42.09 TRINITY_DN98_c0_g1_i10:256-969(-)